MISAKFGKNAKKAILFHINTFDNVAKALLLVLSLIAIRPCNLVIKDNNACQESNLLMGQEVIIQ